MAKDCIHLGREVDKVKSNLCSTRGRLFPVFNCLLHKEYVTRGKHRRNESTYRMCLICDDKETKDE